MELQGDLWTWKTTKNDEGLFERTQPAASDPACPITVPHLSSFPLICPHWAGAAVELGRDSKLPVICNINHLLYRLPLSATSPTNPPGPTQCEPGLSWALSMSLDLCLPFFFFKKKNQHNSLATLHAFSVTVELGFLLEPLAVIAAALGSLLYGLPWTQPLNIWHLTLWREWGLGTCSPPSSLLIFLFFPSLWKKDFQNQFSFQKVYICGEGGGVYLRESVYVCMCL